MIEKPSLFLSFNPAVLEGENKSILLVHSDNLKKCKDYNQKVAYVFHAARTKGYITDLTKMTGMNLLRRSHRALSYAYNSVVLLLFWNTISRETKKFLEGKDAIIKPLPVDEAILEEPPLVGVEEEEVDLEDFLLNEADAAKWLSIRNFLGIKKFTEESPLRVKINDTDYDIRGDDKRVYIQTGNNPGDKSLTVVWKGDAAPVVLNVADTIKLDDEIYSTILKQLYGRTPEGIIESDAIPLKNRPCAEDASDTEKLDYLLTYLTGDHETLAKRLVIQFGELGLSVQKSGKFLVWSREVDGYATPLVKFNKKDDGAWEAQEGGVTRELNDNDKEIIKRMVSACRTHTYSRASKMADAMSSQVVLDKDKWKLMQRVLNSNAFVMLRSVKKEGDYVIWRTTIKDQPLAADKTFISIQHASDYNRQIRFNRLDVHIADDGKLTFRVDGGDCVEVADPKLPGAERVLAEILYKSALKTSSKYSHIVHNDGKPRLQIETVYTSVDDIAVHHFNEVVKTFESREDKEVVALRIVFKEQDGTNMAGIDAGGLGRDFMVRLFGGLLKDSACALKMDYGWTTGGLPMPKAMNAPVKTGALPDAPDSDLSEYFSKLTEAERIQYQNLGYMQMYCFLSSNLAKNFAYVSGQIFHEDAFAAIQKIPYAQAAKEKPDWNWNTWLPVIQQLADKQGGETKDWVDYLKAPSPDKKNEIVEQLRVVDPDALGEGEVLDKQLEKYLKGALVDRYSGQIAALHAMAHGMMKRINKISIDPQSSLASWNKFVEKEKVQDSIQGVLDRDDIVKNIKIQVGCGDIIKQKVKWLKEWIKDEETSEKDLKWILRFITGASSIPIGTELLVTRQVPTPQVRESSLPKVHTCFNQIELAEKFFVEETTADNTKAKFIARMFYAADNTINAGFGAA